MSLRHAINLASLQKKLEDAGYETIDDVRQTNMIDLVRALSLSSEEIDALLTATRGPIPVAQTAQDRILDDVNKRGIRWGCQALDSLFDDMHGIPIGSITEFCGESGAGRTQLSIQLAVQVQLPSDLGGLDGNCIYIDTEGGLFPSRLKTIAQEVCARHPALHVQSVLAGIHIFRVYDHVELVALIRQLKSILDHFPRVKLVILDSIAFPMRLNIRETRVRNGLLNFIAQSLLQIADTQHVAVVAVNNVANDRVRSAWTPALGQTWGHWCAQRLYIYRKRNIRFAHLFKAPGVCHEKTVPFSISEKGISDAEVDRDAIRSDSERNHGHLRENDVSVKQETKDGEDSLWDAHCLPDDVLSQIPTHQHLANAAVEQVEHAVISDAPPNTHEETVRGATHIPSHTVIGKRKHSEIDHEALKSGFDYEMWSSDEEQDWQFLATYDCDTF